MIQLILFVLVSAGIFWFSWQPLHDWHTHGFYRFFAFESILALILMNAGQWFRDPFSTLQSVSWLLLLASLFLILHGFYLLRVIGRPSGNIENTSKLVEIGAYRFIRHPLYSSLLFLAWGAFLKDLSVWSGLLVLVATVALIATAKAEEKENLQKFGAAYKEYVRATKMFVPFVW
jgi:protein-S-isoprenylcysteine O-methyltransferase Ste14